MGARVLVTGATGFIGTQLVRDLQQAGFRVRAMARQSRPHHEPGIEWIGGDVRRVDDVARATENIEWVLHLAGKAHDLNERFGTHEHHTVTQRGTENVVKQARAAGVKRFVFLSSLAVYAPGDESERDELSPCLPATPYGLAKLGAERSVLKESGDMHFCILRPAMVYGPGCKGQLPRMISLIERGLFPPLPPLANRRSQVSVFDVCQAIRLAVEKPEANRQVYVVTDGRPYSTREMFDVITKQLGRPLPGWHVPASALHALALLGDVGERITRRRLPFDTDLLTKLTGSAWFSSEKISRELGYRPRQTLETALPAMLAYRREHHHQGLEPGRKRTESRDVEAVGRPGSACRSSVGQ